MTPEEKTWLKSELQRDQELYGAAQHHNLLDAFRLPAVWILAGVYIIIQIGVYIVNLWMPLILSGLAHGEGSGDASLIARYATVPYVLAAIFTVVVGWSSDRSEREARAYLPVAWCWRRRGLRGQRVRRVSAVALCAMSLVTIGLWSTMGPFWALTTRMIGGCGSGWRGRDDYDARRGWGRVWAH